MGLFSESLVGIDVTSGFKLQAKKPLDVRAQVTSTDDLTALVTENGAYAGMLVYVTDDSALYICTSIDDGGAWDKLFTEGSSTVVDLSASGNVLTYTKADGTKGTISVGSDITVDTALSSTSTNPVQNKVINSAITSLQNDITKVGDAASDAVVSLSADGTTVTYTTGAGNTGTITTQDTVYTHPSVTRSNTTSTGKPAFGGTFTAIDGVTTDDTGHVTAVNTKTVTVPSAAATSTSAGLMSADDKAALDDINAELYTSGAITGLSGAADGVAYTKSNGETDTVYLKSLDASLLTGTVDIARLPASALERCVVVADDTARFALTESDVQLGDTVKVTATNLMYMVVDTDNLASDAGYEVYNASVTWANVINKTNATTSAAGLMSASDKAKLDGIASGATAVTVDTALSSTSTNPVQNKAVTSELNSIKGDLTTLEDTEAADYANSIVGLSVSGTTVTYTKGNGDTGTISTQDTVTTVDDKLDSDSTNPVQNAIVTAGMNGLWDAVDANTSNIATNTTNIAANTAELANKAVSIQLTNEDLNEVLEPGFYHADSSNTCANNASTTVPAFGMTVIHLAGSSYYTQTMYKAGGVVWRRWCSAGTWGDWTQLYFTDTKVTVDTALSSSSTNPVQNKVINTAITSLQSDITDIGDAAGDAIKSLSVDGTTVTYTTNNGTTGSITTQDTTYDIATSSIAGLMSADDKLALDDLQRDLYTSGVVSSIEATDTGFEYTKTTGAITAVELPQIYFATSLPTTAPTGSICCVIEE